MTRFQKLVELCALGCLCLLTSRPVLAETAPGESNEELKAMLKQLIGQVEVLQNRVNELEAKGAKATEPLSTSAADQELQKLTTDGPQTSPAASDATKVADGGSTFSRYQNDIISRTTVGGYASIEGEDFDGQNSTFDQHRFVVNVGSQLTSRLRFYSEVEYEHGTTIESEGSASGEISIADSNGNGVIDAEEADAVEVSLDTESGRSGELEVEQVWMQYDIVKNLGVRGGMILVPFGKYNLTHDDDLHLLTDRPLVARRVVPTTWSEAGIGLVGSAELGRDSSLQGEFYIVNGLNDNISSGSGALRDARGSFESDNNNNKALVGRLAFSPILGSEFGISGYRGAYDEAGNDINAGAFDWDVKLGDFTLVGEYALFGIQDGVNESGARVPSRLSGVYAEVDYGFWFSALNSTFLGSGFDDPKFYGVLRYNYATIERRGELASLDQDTYAVGLVYRPTTSFAFKNEFQWNDGSLERGDSDGFISSIAIGF